MNLRCLPNHVIVEPLARSRPHMKIVDAHPEPPAEGRVVAVGRVKLKSGAELPAEVFAGAWVIFRPFAGRDVEFDGKKLKLLKQTELEAAYTG